VLRRVLVPLALLAAAPADAQVFGSVSALSEYRYRGASLSDDRPVLQLHLGYDFAAGGYAGALLSNVRVDGRSQAQALLYAGRTWTLRDDWHSEAGAQYTAFSRSGEYDHLELYAGFGSPHAGIRLHYANDYFGRLPAWYLEYDARDARSGPWHLVAHVGVLHANGSAGACCRQDWSFGVAVTQGDYEWQLAWNGAHGDLSHATGYTTPGYGSEEGPVLRVTRSW
jgi:uncharacterized protein (TIGR02001 family)